MQKACVLVVMSAVKVYAAADKLTVGLTLEVHVVLAGVVLVHISGIIGPSVHPILLYAVGSHGA